MKRIEQISFCAKVIAGERIGTPFGIATANLDVKEEPEGILDGVYCVEVLYNEQKYAGVMHIGPRLTFGASKTYEVHILRFDQDIYAQEIDVTLLGYLRETKKFANADMLYTQIEKDVMQTEKYFLRKDVLGMWKTVTEAEKESWAQKVLEYFVENEIIQEGMTVFGFAPMKDEIPYVSKLCKTFVKNVYTFPRVMPDGMHFHAQKYENLLPGAYGILEPSLDSPVRAPKPGDLVLVPGVLGNQSGDRLGRGGGFYDRFLADLPKGVRTIMVLPAFAKKDHVPREAHDQGVDEVLFVE